MKRIEIQGLKFDVRPYSSDEKAIQEVVVEGCYRRKYFNVEAGERWLDLGANIGAFSCYALSRGASVWAYEPEPTNAQLLDNNISINGFSGFTLTRAAIVSDFVEERSVNLFLSDKHGAYWRSSLYNHHNRRKITVPAVRISSILGGIDCVKMDIEGAEIDILYNLDDWQSVRKLVFEYHFDKLNSVPYFLWIAKRLKKHFTSVIHRKFKPDAVEYNYNPSGIVVFCWRT